MNERTKFNWKKFNFFFFFTLNLIGFFECKDKLSAERKLMAQVRMSSWCSIAIADAILVLAFCEEKSIYPVVSENFMKTSENWPEITMRVTNKMKYPKNHPEKHSSMQGGTSAWKVQTMRINSKNEKRLVCRSFNLKWV